MCFAQVFINFLLKSNIDCFNDVKCQYETRAWLQNLHKCCSYVK